MLASLLEGEVTKPSSIFNIFMTKTLKNVDENIYTFLDSLSVSQIIKLYNILGVDFSVNKRKWSREELYLIADEVFTKKE